MVGTYMQNCVLYIFSILNGYNVQRIDIFCNLRYQSYQPVPKDQTVIRAFEKTNVTFGGVYEFLAFFKNDLDTIKMNITTLISIICSRNST